MAIQTDNRLIESTGISEIQWEQIFNVLRQHPSMTRAILFGSRAMGTYSPSSDIDLALVGVEDELKAASIASELEELPLPYKFDVLALSAIEFQPLLEHIERVGLSVYLR